MWSIRPRSDRNIPRVRRISIRFRVVPMSGDEARGAAGICARPASRRSAMYPAPRIKTNLGIRTRHIDIGCTLNIAISPISVQLIAKIGEAERPPYSRQHITCIGHQPPWNRPRDHTRKGRRRYRSRPWRQREPRHRPGRTPEPWRGTRVIRGKSPRSAIRGRTLKVACPFRDRITAHLKAYL